jgi:hypothetical protein
MNNSLQKAVEQAFAPLVSEFRLHTLRAAHDAFGDEIVIGNMLVAVQLRYEPREQRVFASLLRLRNGAIPSRDIEDRIRDPINGFDVQDLIALRAPSVQIPLVPPHQEAALTNALREFASFLMYHGRDVLSGDFSVFVDLARRVANRIREFALQGRTVAPESEAFLLAFNALERFDSKGEK